MKDKLQNESITPTELEDILPLLTVNERLEGLGLLARNEAEDLFLRMTSHAQADLLLNLPQAERRSWIRLLPPDDAADILQSVDKIHHEELLRLIDDPTRKEISALLAYKEDHAGGLMNPRFARVRPDMNIDEAITYLKRQTRSEIETIYYIYILDEQQHLLGVISFRDLFSAKPEQKVRDIMRTHIIKVTNTTDQEELSKLFAQYNLLAVPVVDADNRLQGIVTIDDIVHVVNEEATEDIQKMGGMEALDMPYLKTRLPEMIRKRGGWLSALFLGEMLTATAMGYFEKEIARAVVLALFVPLIISSGGNSGSQATTLVIRALALGELTLRDWWLVVRREILSGMALGTLLGSIGFVRILSWQYFFQTYGEHYMLVALTVSFSLIGVVMFGTLAGSMLPFILKNLKFDPASASAPFVATLVDVTGLIIYFSVAGMILKGTLL
jgi:magnesium transporter